MNPWAVRSDCSTACSVHAVRPESTVRSLRRCAAFTRAITRELAKAYRLAETGAPTAGARALLAALGVRVEDGPQEHGPPCGRRTGVLVVANHMSWLDPLVLVSIEPGVVLARHDVGRWPVIGTLARQAGTVFIDRGNPRQLPVVVATVASVLRSGRTVMFFPQATTWCTASGGRFRRAVFQAAVDAGALLEVLLIRNSKGSLRGCSGHEGRGSSRGRCAAGADGGGKTVVPHWR
ncbi:lysophospholipid acyltransferase family protein, partial [Streptomyces lavendulae]|uniref:lysophospholipid acyltransferase family protein n=1 Tax=Streptomyces lavendulae TaxID=1914 RepID=UPI003D7FA616